MKAFEGTCGTGGMIWNEYLLRDRRDRLMAIVSRGGVDSGVLWAMRSSEELCDRSGCGWWSSVLSQSTRWLELFVRGMICKEREGSSGEGRGDPSIVLFEVGVEW